MQVKKLVSDIIKISDDLEKKDTQLLYQEKVKHLNQFMKF